MRDNDARRGRCGALVSVSMLQGGKVHLRVFGVLAAARDPFFSEPIRISSKKGCALLAYLALSAQHSATREQLAALLWGDSSDQQARQSLRQAILLLRKDLHPAPVIDAGPDAVRLLPGTVHADAMEFEALSTSDALADLERAASLVHGELLAGFNLEEEGFEEWLRQQRHRFETAGSGVVERYARECDRLGKGPQAIAAVERLLALGPLREDWQRLALRLYARHRGPNEALAQAKVYTDLLQRELDVELEPQTQALIEEIKRSAFASPAVLEAKTAKPNVVAPETAPAWIEARNESAPPRPRGLRAVQDKLAGPWASLRQHPSRGIAVGAVAALLILLVGSAALMIGRSASPPAVAVSGKRGPAPPAADPWQSPTAGLNAGAIAARSKEKIIPIIVLPFASDAEADAANTPLADQITDDLINMLSRIYRFRVISRNTSRSYRGKTTDPAQLGADLGVRYVLEGSVRSQGKGVRVNVELVDTATRLALWSDQIEHERADRHVLAHGIVLRIGRALQVHTQKIEVLRAGDQTEEVHQLVEKGWVVMFGPGKTGERLKQGQALFMEALQKDPASVPAQVGLAAYHVELVADLEAADFEPHIKKAISLLEGAAAKAPRSSSVNFWLGRAYRHRGDFEVALRHFARALELNPSEPNGHAQIGLTLLFLRRPAEALPHIRYAMRLSPKDQSMPWWLRFAAEAELELSHYAQAAKEIERSIELSPNQLRSWGVLAAAQALAGNADAARKAVAKVRQFGAGYSDEQLLQRIGRSARIGSNRLHDGLQVALAMEREGAPAAGR